MSDKDFKPLGELASLIALLAVALYFAGWVYRWAYFGFFKIGIASLDLPVESFYLAAFHALFGGPWILVRTFLGFALALLGILLTWQTWKLLKAQIRLPDRLHRSLSRSPSFQFVDSLVDEIVFVFWVLTVLYFLARGQADLDVWLDAVNETSDLPVVSVLLNDQNAALGRNLNDPFANPDNFRIVGDRATYDRLLGKETNDASDPDRVRTWRLLSDRGSYFYIFPALPERDRHLSIPVVKIYASSLGDQLVILRPCSNKPTCLP